MDRVSRDGTGRGRKITKFDEAPKTQKARYQAVASLLRFGTDN